MASFWFEYEESGEIEEFTFERERVSIGRGRSADFVLDHPTVSRQHAEIVAEPSGRFRLIVRSDRGLTAVDGSEIQDEVELRDGSQVYFGELRFRFRSERAQPSSEGSRASSASGANRRDGPPQTGATGSGGGAVSGASRSESSGASGGDDSGPGGPPDIATWDEVAESGLEDESDPTETTGGGDAGGAGRESDGDEETDPLLVVIGLSLSAALLAYSFWPTGGGGGDSSAMSAKASGTPVEIEVECPYEQECRSAALETYRVGMEYLEKQETETGNLFNAYKRFLQTRSYLKKAGKGAAPKEISGLDDKIENVRGELDRIFRNYRVKYRSAKKNGRQRAMVRALETIQRYFPDKSAREYRWARKRILRMKEKGTYPAGMGTQF